MESGEWKIKSKGRIAVFEFNFPFSTINYQFKISRRNFATLGV